jgi:hypothetical protein
MGIDGKVKQEINFFWSGSDWTYLHDLTIKSHLKVGHIPVLWIHGKQPKSIYWDTDIYNEWCCIRNADDIIDISGFIKKGGNFKTASSLWRFNFLYEYGGWYSDTDAIAINPWPDEEWVICGEDDTTLSTGVIKVPPKQEMFLDMMDDLELEWGNVVVFNKHYEIHHGNTNETIDGKMFYPYSWENWIDLLKIREIPNVYSVHLYHTMFERHNIIDRVSGYANNVPNSLLGRIGRWVTS